MSLLDAIYLIISFIFSLFLLNLLVDTALSIMHDHMGTMANHNNITTSKSGVFIVKTENIKIKVSLYNYFTCFFIILITHVISFTPVLLATQASNMLPFVVLLSLAISTFIVTKDVLKSICLSIIDDGIILATKTNAPNSTILL
jgi:hypothetical protein